MRIDGYELLLECGAKFHRSAYIYGWFHHPKDKLKALELLGPGNIATIAEVNLNHPGVEAHLGPQKGFKAQVLYANESDFQNIRLRFITECGIVIEQSLVDLCNDRVGRFETPALFQHFHSRLNTKSRPKILDVGGRARSHVDRRSLFPNADYVVLDILAGDNVDIVGDAHELSRIFGHGTFDAVFSVSVFEHLAMPWKVAVEINKVLRQGGIALIHTHQTLGMHDLPWDFFRFSSDSWDGLFNSQTGFNILRRAMDAEQFVIPFVFRQGKEIAEASAGFEGSSVLVEKIGPTTVDWNVRLQDILATKYPSVD